MKRQTRYEWKLEAVDQHGDVQDGHHWDNIYQIIQDVPAMDEEATRCGWYLCLCLVRDIVNDRDGVISRHHWYPATNEMFPVPKKYLVEFGRAISEYPEVIFELMFNNRR